MCCQSKEQVSCGASVISHHRQVFKLSLKLTACTFPPRFITCQVLAEPTYPWMVYVLLVSFLNVIVL